MTNTGSSRVGKARKQAANLTVDSNLLSRAKSLGLNVSSVLEEGLRAKIREEEGRRWLIDNEKAIDELNQETKAHGLWSDGLRQF